MTYVLHQDEHEKRELKQQEFLIKLIDTLCNKYITLGTQLFIHFAMMTLSTTTIGFALVILYIAIFIIKLFRFHHFMIY